MDKELTKSLELILKWAEQSGDFIKEQTPLLVQEIINYYTIWYLICFILILLLASIAIYIFNKLINNSQFDFEEKIITRLIIIVLSIISFIYLEFILSQFLKVYLAPRLFIIEYLRDLIK